MTSLVKSIAQFSCDVCNLSFDRSRDFEEHIAAMHPGHAIPVAAIVLALEGVVFPRTRAQLVADLEGRLLLDDERLAVVRALPEREYRSAAEVRAGLAEVKRRRRDIVRHDAGAR